MGGPRTALNANISRWRRRREVPVADPETVADRPTPEETANSTVDRAIASLRDELVPTQQES